MSMYKNIITALKKKSGKKRAEASAWFFKTGKGEYGEGDIFWGLTVPEQRTIAKQYSDASLTTIDKLMKSKVHEQRLTGLLILLQQYQKNPDKKLVNFYLDRTKWVNNWDLVDLTAHKILGHHLIDKKRNILYKLAKSKVLWERRIAIISCFAFINQNDFRDAIKLAELLLHDDHDLMHKAVGWVLREIGKKDLAVEEKFLKKHYKTMPRTMLRYAIERFEEKKRQRYLKGKY